MTADLLVSMYGRSRKYNDDFWDIAAGPLTDEQYLKFKKLADKACPNYFDLEHVELPNGGMLDVPHFWAVINGQIKGYSNTCGWAGDTATLSKEMEYHTASGFPSSTFDMEDWHSDADACNLKHINPNDYLGNLASYLRNVTDQSRATMLASWGGFSGQTWTKKDKGALGILLDGIDGNRSGFTAALSTVEAFINEMKLPWRKINITVNNFEDFNDDISISTSDGQNYNGSAAGSGLTIDVRDTKTVSVFAFGHFMKTATIKVGGATVELDDYTYSFEVSGDTNIQVDFQDKPFVTQFSALTNDSYILESASSIYNVDIPDFSSLAISPKTGVLFGVSNTRQLSTDPEVKPVGGVYTIALEDETNPIEQYWVIPGKSKASVRQSYEDTEALAIDRRGDIYLGFERLQQLVKIDGNAYDDTCDYNVITTFDFSGGTRGHKPNATIDVDGYEANEGIEGIEWLSGKTFFVSNSVRPAEVTLYDAEAKTILNTQILTDPVEGEEIWAPTTNNKREFEIADLCYVKGLNELWVMDSDRAVIYRYKVNISAENGTDYLTYVSNIMLPMGTGVTLSLTDGIPTYTLNDAAKSEIAANNPEALVVDEKNGIIYVGAEGDSVVGKIYVFSVDEFKKKV